MADVALIAGGVEETPLDYTIPGAQEIIVKAATASFDGTSAAGGFVPTLLIKAPNGAVLAACPIGSTIAAGASADVSWFPRGGLSSGTGGGDGIQFTADGVYGPANSGDALAIATNGPGTTGDGFAVSIVDSSDNGINLESSGGGVVQLHNGATILGLNDNAEVVGVLKAADAAALSVSDATHGTWLLVDTSGKHIKAGFNLAGSTHVAGFEGGSDLAMLFAGTSGNNNLQVGATSTTINVISGGKLFVIGATGILITVDSTTGGITLHLPTSPGASGTLWNNAGVVQVAP